MATNSLFRGKHLVLEDHGHDNFWYKDAHNLTKRNKAETIRLLDELIEERMSQCEELLEAKKRLEGAKLPEKSAVTRIPFGKSGIRKEGT